MLAINPIKKGIVIDHIKAGLGMKIFYYLGLDKVDFPVALIMNVHSGKNEKKDIIKIENQLDVDLTALGFIDPGITIDIIEEEKVVRKVKPRLPERIENVVKCNNPRCITSVEQEISHNFYLVDREKGTYRCEYCDEVYRL
ncbi:aspartate carbamoyltransferase regulatory subunit [Hathewaya massiliensis]|uniref:aspartate carbamoyltransferase regulatory subunit n=1 Tax=Hathewaya massiliensis TaxID=1964382 RepID=UPI0011594B01|nr:aspartate carbamoyltransferase regulatory subunit [Hathewaya massiliensis]